MSDEPRYKIEVNIGEAALIIGIVALIIMFAGTPDLADAIIYRLTDGRSGLPSAVERHPPEEQK